MDHRPLSLQEKESIVKFFGKPIEELNPHSYRQLLRELRSRYHPDNFEKFGDETVRELATEKFQIIEHLAGRIEEHFKNDPNTHSADWEDYLQRDARFAFDRMKIEINTADKDLKYHLFGTYYRWLVYGDSYKIPGTRAQITIDDNHQGNSIGYRETIRMYLSFGENDSTEDIVRWLFTKIEGRADSLIIHKELVQVDFNAILIALKRQSYLSIGMSA
jgi:hypothetical protein